MNIIMNQKEVTPLNLVKTVYASVIEDINEHFEQYASIFINNFNDYNEEEKNVIQSKKNDFYKKLNLFLGKNKLV